LVLEVGHLGGHHHLVHLEAPVQHRDLLLEHAAEKVDLVGVIGVLLRI
jgi:hypothetical protein